jgi:TfoX/Sxy family transcriptional regulator of competence genes
MQQPLDMGARSLDIEPNDIREAADLTVEYGRYTLGIETGRRHDGRREVHRRARDPRRRHHEDHPGLLQLELAATGVIGAAAARDNAAVAYDEDLANRIRELVRAESGVSEQRMFGGLAFLVNGNMAVSASGQGGLLLRVDPAETEALVRKPHAEPFEMRGRAMRGWLRVDPEGVRTKRELERWVSRGVTYARSLPSKE